MSAFICPIQRVVVIEAARIPSARFRGRDKSETQTQEYKVATVHDVSLTFLCAVPLDEQPLQGIIKAHTAPRAEIYALFARL